MPIRVGLAHAAREGKHRSLDPNQITILVMGGSQGAHALNEIVTRALCECHQVGHKLQVIHLAGQHDYQAVKQNYGKSGVSAAVYGFTQDMASIYQKTDLAISRSGAATCAELSAFGVPALLIPYPYASKDHQTANSRAMEKIGAAEMVPEYDLSASWLKDYVSQCIQTPGRLARMSAATKKRASRRGAEALADLVEEVARGEPALLNDSGTPSGHGH